MNDETAIRDVSRWVDAVSAQNLDGVLADHDPNIVMFDVPPPFDGVRGIDAYRQSWPPFFEWLRQGAEFRLLECDVDRRRRRRIRARASAVRDTGRLRGQPRQPAADHRRVAQAPADRWVVAHEHHLVPDGGHGLVIPGIAQFAARDAVALA